MSRFTFFADIAGQVSFDTKGSNRITAAAVAIPSVQTDAVRSRLFGLPKWRDCSEEVAEEIVALLVECASAIAVSSITKDSESWEHFWRSNKPLHDAIVRQDRVPAGFIKPSNVIRFAILGDSFAMALGHAVRIAHRPGIVDDQARELIERTIVCDSDVQGDENVAVFKSFWEQSDVDQPKIHKAGFRFVTREVIVTTEQSEPLLLLADVVAGVAHSALITNPGRLTMPVPNEPSKRLLGILNDSGKLVVSSKPFALKYEEVFGDVLVKAERQNAR